MSLSYKYFSSAAFALLGLWLAIGGYATLSFTECFYQPSIFFGFYGPVCVHTLLEYAILYFSASSAVFVQSFRFMTSDNRGKRLARSDDLGNFLIFLGGMMLVAGLIAPFFSVGLKLLEGYWGIGIVLLVIGILFRRFLAP